MHIIYHIDNRISCLRIREFEHVSSFSYLKRESDYGQDFVFIFVWNYVIDCHLSLLSSPFTIVQNSEVTKQLEYLRGVVTNAFADRDHAILEVIIHHTLYLD